MNYNDERKKRTYKYLAHLISYGKPTPEEEPELYDGAELGRAVLGRMKLGKR